MKLPLISILVDFDPYPDVIYHTVFSIRYLSVSRGAAKSGPAWGHHPTVYLSTWRFPKIGGTPNHPFLFGIFREKNNNPFWGTPIYGNPQYVHDWIILDVSSLVI